MRGARHAIEAPMQNILNKLSASKLLFSLIELVSIPETIELMSSLEILNLSENKTKHIPDVFENLKSIKYLNLSRNEIVDIPKSISSLPKLKELYLSEN